MPGDLKFALLATLALTAPVAGCSRPAADKAHPVIAVEVTVDGFVPRRAFAPRGVPVTLVITRRTDETCATDVVIAGRAEKWDLPLGRAVRIEVAEGVRDTLRYACGMNMFHGEVVAR